jgi:beta-glucosidase
MDGHHHHTHYFPKHFLWGTATAAHQVEGYNYNNDWWQAEQQGKLRFKSGAACDHYHRSSQDFDLAQKMHNNAHRLSVEWSRLEPRPGEWNYPAVEHYRKVLTDLRNRKITVMLTLHHFTLPSWLADKGGFAKFRNLKYFTRYVKFAAQQFQDLVDFWITINEPGVYIYQGYEMGDWPPFKKSSW